MTQYKSVSVGNVSDGKDVDNAEGAIEFGPGSAPPTKAPQKFFPGEKNPNPVGWHDLNENTDRGALDKSFNRAGGPGPKPAQGKVFNVDLGK